MEKGVLIVCDTQGDVTIMNSEIASLDYVKLTEFANSGVRFVDSMFDELRMLRDPDFSLDTLYVVIENCTKNIKDFLMSAFTRGVSIVYERHSDASDLSSLGLKNLSSLNQVFVVPEIKLGYRELPSRIRKTVLLENIYFYGR